MPLPGRLAQLGERFPYKEEVGGSSPSTPTTPVSPGQSVFGKVSYYLRYCYVFRKSGSLVDSLVGGYSTGV